ncbi:MAG: phage tail protein [Campylobacterota bacterium]|nr:phage tail protein [Campylobacterota bacterium]
MSNKEKYKHKGTNNSFVNYKYKIEIKGIESMAFSEMSELSNETDVFPYKEGGRNGYVHKFPEHTEYTNIELKHGMGLDDDIYKWRNQVISGELDAAKRNGTIKLYNNEGEDETDCVWSFYNAWPSKLSVSSLDAKSNGEVIIESVELVVERFERQ